MSWGKRMKSQTQMTGKVKVLMTINGRYLKLPGLWEDQGLKGLDGTVWFRHTINLDVNEVSLPAMLEIGKIDDMDETYVNGILVGQTDSWDTSRKYTLPKGLLKQGRNVIAVKVIDYDGFGGIYGKPENMLLTVGNHINRYRENGSLCLRR